MNKHKTMDDVLGDWATLTDEEIFDFIDGMSERITDRINERDRILANLSRHSQEEFQKEIEIFHKDVYKTSL
ncbi:TPA: hypothetical protein QHB43_001182 [Aeromonas hydrophila subsp. hydrophila]|nr:hypothetical protein [Aeromonas hydrophila subsp. hydrophila]